MERKPFTFREVTTYTHPTDGHRSITRDVATAGHPGGHYVDIGDAISSAYEALCGNTSVESMRIESVDEKGKVLRITIERLP